uniref:Fibronectin type-III domain-containing protein n=1 Tax=Panagrolaimus superbus TaxID=310955 RepID=A0A914Z837_9BILA
MPFILSWRCSSDTYEYKETRCVTAERCHSLLSVKTELQKERLKWKAFHGKCHYNCPDGFQEDPKNPRNCIICESYCPRKCSGATVQSIGEAMRFSKCNIIVGTLEISVQNPGFSAKAEQFTQAFENIREITGALLIQFSATFTSLHMFKNLEIIHGNKLINKRYALSVMDLENLQQLFSPEVEQKLQIRNGLVNFQNNNKLCYSRIIQFVKNINLKQNVTDNDISKFSNGDKAICEEIPLPVSVIKNFTFGFTLKWSKFNTSDMDQRKFLGYIVYHKKVDRIDSKLQIDDDRSACGDSWKLKFLPENENENVQDVTCLVEDLDPNTLYAYYVQTKTIHHSGAKNAISKIGFVKTLFDTPEEPRLKRYEALGSSKIVLEWDPPIKTNGKITHYILMWNAKSIGSDNRDPCGMHSAVKKSLSKSIISEGTCAADKGCCKCDGKNNSDHEKTTFKKLNQNNGQMEPEKSALLMQQPTNVKEVTEDVNTSKVRTIRSIVGAKQPKKPKAEIIYPEIYNENITYGIANISSTRVILTGLNHFTEYSIQIRACQDITVPENSCSKQAAFRIVQTQPIPENDIIDLNSIKVFPYIVNGTEQGDSRVISLKIPADPNGVILGFKFKIWRKNEEKTHAERCITKKNLYIIMEFWYLD